MWPTKYHRLEQGRLMGLGVTQRVTFNASVKVVTDILIVNANHLYLLVSPFTFTFTFTFYFFLINIDFLSQL